MSEGYGLSYDGDYDDGSGWGDGYYGLGCGDGDGYGDGDYGFEDGAYGTDCYGGRET